MPSFNIFKRKKKEDFLVIEVGLEKIACALFKKEESLLKLAGIGKKKFSSPADLFDSVLEALDALTAIVPEIPPRGILGVCGGTLSTTTTIAKYQRPNPRSPIKPAELKDVLGEVVANLATEEKKILFSTVASGLLDGVRVTNPLGLKGENAELSCFVAFKDASEMELLDRVASEIDLKVEKILPTSFAVAKILEPKNLKEALIFRAGQEKSEFTVLIDGHISEIVPVDLGMDQSELLPFAWMGVLKNLKKEERPALIWLFADHEGVELPKLKEMLLEFPWHAKLGLEIVPKVEIAETFHQFSASDIGIYALSQIGVD